MRILLAGNGNQIHRGARYYDQCLKLYNGLVRNGHNVFFLSDRDVARSGAPLGIAKLGKKYCNEYFLDVCRHFKPQMIVMYHADIITTETLLEARQILKDVKIAQFNVDIIFNAHNVEQISNKLDAVNATFVTTAGRALKKFSRPGKTVSFVPNMTDASMEWPKCFEVAQSKHDVFWALRALKGSVEGDRRIEYPLFLEQHGIDIDYHGMNGKPLLYDAQYFEAIAACEMGINISQIWTRGHYEKPAAEELYLYSSDRLSHYMGSGLLTLCTRDHRLHEMFEEDKEMVFFDSKEELLDKVKFYNTNDHKRRTVAQAGWEKYHACYNERLVAKYITERTLGLDLSEAYRWPVECW